MRCFTSTTAAAALLLAAAGVQAKDFTNSRHPPLDPICPLVLNFPSNTAASSAGSGAQFTENKGGCVHACGRKARRNLIWPTPVPCMPDPIHPHPHIIRYVNLQLSNPGSATINGPITVFYTLLPTATTNYPKCVYECEWIVERCLLLSCLDVIN